MSFRTQIMKADLILDAKGLYCPMPSVKTSLQLEKMKIGQIIEVLTTDQASKRDLPAWAEGTGNKLLNMETDKEGITHILIEKTTDLKL